MHDFPTRFREAVHRGQALVSAPGTAESTMAFARSVAAGLADRPKWLHCRFLYDAEGSRLFEQITEQPEYYPTRTESAILAQHAQDIRRITGPRTLVELGSGYSVKTEYLLDAYRANEDHVLYVPVDVSGTALREASKAISRNFADVKVTGINGTYGSALPVLRQLSPQMVVFLGSTIGNFNAAEATAFWRNVSGHIPVGDFILLGVDLVKPVEVLEAAYNDAAGITARFTRNYAARMNRELAAGIDLDKVEHLAIWNAELERMEMFLRFRAAQRIHIQPLGETYEVDAGEQIMTEISRKFRIPQLTEELNTHGFDVLRTFTDDREWFALLLLERIDDSVLRRAPQPLASN